MLKVPPASVLTTTTYFPLELINASGCKPLLLEVASILTAPALINLKYWRSHLDALWITVVLAGFAGFVKIYPAGFNPKYARTQFSVACLNVSPWGFAKIYRAGAGGGTLNKPNRSQAETFPNSKSW